MKQRIFTMLYTLRSGMTGPQREQGFIPLMIGVFLFVAGLAFLVYLRVARAQQ